MTVAPPDPGDRGTSAGVVDRLQELCQNSDQGSQRPLSHVLMTQPQPAQETVLRSRGVEPLVWEDEDPGRATRLFLEALLQAMRPNQS